MACLHSNCYRAIRDSAGLALATAALEQSNLCFSFWDVNIFSFIFKKFQIKIVSDNYTFARCVKVIKNRKELTDEKLNSLEEVVMDSVKARAIIDASKSSMGMDISILDLLNIELFADRVIALAEYR